MQSRAPRALERVRPLQLRFQLFLRAVGCALFSSPFISPLQIASFALIVVLRDR